VSPDLNTGLHTLCYPTDPPALGSVVLYPLDAGFAAAWNVLASHAKAKAGRDAATPSYSAVATALIAATGQPVRLFPDRDLARADTEHGTCALLATTAEIDSWVMATALRVFERLTLNDPSSDMLAPLITQVGPQRRALADFITVNPATGAVSAPGWIYDAARWNLAARIAAAPLTIDGHLPVMLRLDTDGNLLAWDLPLTRESRGDGRAGHATTWISVKIITLPGAAGLYLRLDGHISRHPSSWSFVKNAWLDRGDPALPILRLPVLSPYPERGRDLPSLPGFTAEVTEAVGQHAITLPAVLPDPPGPVRPIGNPRRHPIGKGPGVRFLYQLGAHATRQLQTEPLRYAKTPISVGEHIQGPIAPARLDDAIAASGTEHLQITCLYSTDAARRRMIDALAPYAAAGPATLTGVPDDTPVTLTARLTVVTHQATELLRHGTHQRHAEAIPCLTAPEGTAVAVLTETDYAPDSPPPDDAKPLVRQLLASHDIVSQFLNVNWAPPRPRKRKVGDIIKEIQPADEPAIAAVRDLLRNAGVIDNRLAAATAGPGRAGALDREATLIGLHIRQHTPRRKGGAKPQNRLVIRLVAIYATPDPELPWRITAYDDKHGRWMPYRQANAAYHAADIGHAGLTRERKNQQAIRDLVEEALTAGAFSSAVPLVIFADGEACSGIWPGLNNSSLGRGPLPGSSLSHPDLAVVRCVSGERVPQATHRGHGRTPKDDPHKPPLPRASLYEHNENGMHSWLLAQPSRTYRSSQLGVRAGADYTRWTLPDSEASRMGKDWHGLTATEVTIATPGQWDCRHLAALTARLCQQAASWDDRTQNPAPVHLAERPDLDHPQRAEQPSQDNGGA
jgi:hypothetical protein